MFGGLVSFAFAGAVGAFAGWVGWRLVHALLPEVPASVRLASWGATVATILVLAARLLLALGVFDRPSALALFGAAALLATLAGRRGARDAARALATDLAAARRAISALFATPWGIALAAVAALGALRVLRGLVLPPLGWDALVYHLFKAGRWVALGAHHAEAAPGAWGFHEWFPAAGDVLWAWALLAARDGALLSAGGGLVWLFTALAAHALARALGAEDRAAAGAALVVAATPAVLGATTAAYVDTTMLALFLAGAALLVHAPRSLGAACLAGAAWGLAAAVKPSLLPAPVAGAAVLLLASPRAAAAFLAGAALPLGVEYVPTWIAKGSPLWPFPLAIGGRTLLAGDGELALQYAGHYARDVVERFPRFEFLRWLFGAKRNPGSDFAGFGLFSAPIVALGLGGIAIALRRRENRVAIAAALLAVLALLAAALSDANVAQRTVWVGVLGRHLAPAFALLAALAALPPVARVSRIFFGLAIAGGWAMSFPLGWGETDVEALGALAPPLATGVVLAAGAGWLLRKRPPLAIPVAAALALAPLAVVLPGIRAETRYAAWDEAARTGTPYDLHFLDGAALSAWRAWKRLDGPTPSHVAVTAGYAREGQAWYLYPLLGSGLANRVRYVPPTGSGEVPDLRDPGAAVREYDREAWIARLLEEEIDFVMALWPPAPERLLWIDRMPEVFPVEIDGGEAGWALHRFDREAARHAAGAR